MTAIEIVADDGARRPVPRGWVLLILALASWGIVSIVAVAVWGVVVMFG